MLKFTGMLLIFIACTGAGCRKSAQLQQKLAVMELWQEMLRHIRWELCSTREPLPAIFAGMGRGRWGTWTVFWQQLGRNMNERSGKPIEDLWNEALKQNEEYALLGSSCRYMLQSLGRQWNQKDIAGAEESLRICQQRLEEEIRSSRSEISEKKRLCRCFGAAGGIVISLLFL